MRLDHLLSKETSNEASSSLVMSYGQYKSLELDALFNLEGTSRPVAGDNTLLTAQKEGLRQLDWKERANKKRNVSSEEVRS